VTRQHVQKNSSITEAELLRYCSNISEICNGKEYFANLDFDKVIEFLESGADV
jgi:hypothetical protein